MNADDGDRSTDARVRVLHVVNGDLFSGAERVQDLLAARLRDHGFDVGFAALKAGLFESKRKTREAPLHVFEMRNRYDVVVARRIAALVRRDGYKLLHTHTPRSAMVGRIASLMASVPMVHHVHSPTVRDTENAWRNRVNAWTEGLSLLGVPALIPVSGSLARHLISLGYASSRIQMVANGVPVLSELPAHPVPSGCWTIGTVALFRPRKGIEILLNALALLRARGVAARMLAVGPFESEAYEREIKGLCQQLGLDGAIDWTGFTSDVAAQFQRMDAFVLPSLYGEGMPMVVLEAMAQGIPVVASSVEGIPEVIEHGRSGLVVAPASPEALAAELTSLMDGRYDWVQMRSLAAATQRQRFSDRSMAKGVADVYRTVLALAGRSRRD